MQYALMIYTEPGYDEALPEAEREAARAEYLALADEIDWIAGARLQPVEMATSVRVVNGRTLMTDGFRDFVGPYVAQCHNLAREDHAMMFGWTIVP